MKIALLCSGLGNIKRGHETFIRELFDLLKNDLDVTLLKGEGGEKKNEIVIFNIPRNSQILKSLKNNLVCSDKWREAIDEERRTKLEMETFAYNSLPYLLKADYDIIQCPEAEVINILYQHREFFKKRPFFVYSNGGALPPNKYPLFDFVQHHSFYSYSIAGRFKKKSFLIPYCVNLNKFYPAKIKDKSIRKRFNIPPNVFLILSAGAICDNHKRMPHLIKEVNKIANNTDDKNNKNVHLLILGEESGESEKIKEFGKKILKNRIHFGTVEHEELPKAYQSADLFVLCSLFESFGIVFLEAMACKLPIISTNHKNQKWIMGDSAVLINMKKEGLLAEKIKLLMKNPLLREQLAEKGYKEVKKFSANNIKKEYVQMYKKILKHKIVKEKYGLKNKIKKNVENLFKKG